VPTEDELATILKRYAQLEDAVVSKIASDLQLLPTQTVDARRETAKSKILSKLELHSHADALVEEAVAKYREDLYFVARRVAEEDLESGIINRAHVRQAQSRLSRHRKKYGWGDGLLAVGGICLGSAVPHVLALASPDVKPSAILIVVGLFGALLWGAGIVDKAKS